MKKVFIWGSCVSRDCFNYSSSYNFELVSYHARCSCVSAMSNPVSYENVKLCNLKSKFKQNTIINDFNKNLLKDLKSKSFDILLIDFIDERFPIKIDKDGNIITVSSELLETNYVSLDNSLIYVGDEKRFSLWKKSWDKFITICIKLGIKDKIIINRLHWAKYMENNERIPNFTEQYITTNNSFLDRIYSTIDEYIPKTQQIYYPNNIILANSKHRWNISPFHYIDNIYNHTNKSLNFISSIPIFLKDRTYDTFFDFTNKDIEQNKIRLISNGNKEINATFTRFHFNNKDKYYYFRAIIPEKFNGNGIAIRFRITGWEENYNYTFGYLSNGKLYKIKGKHIIDNHWYSLICSKNDLVFKLDNNNTENTIDTIEDIRFVICGDFNKEAFLDVSNIYIWNELNKLEDFLCLNNHTILDEENLVDKLVNYISNSNLDAHKQYHSFMKKGSMPISKINLNWQVMQQFPDKFFNVGTFSWSWLCLHPVQICSLKAYKDNDIGALCAAREFAAHWLDHFFNMEKSFSMEWHEHAVAERTISLLFLYLLGKKYSFDWRFMSRIKIAIILHSRLLCSEAFYVRHQLTRFHNHGMFQDMALILAGTVFAELPSAEYWRHTAIKRLKEMLNAIFPQEDNVRISYENSFGYHCAGYELFAKLSKFLIFLEDKKYFTLEANKIKTWTDLLSYSTKQFPAFGDTFRDGSGERFIHKNRPEKIFIIKRKSGYAILRGYHDNSFYTVIFIASNITTTHKHCDNLSFTLYFDGIEWFIDPSFYNHEYSKGLSKYLRSPEAHNIIYIDDMHYSLSPGLVKIEGELNNNIFKLYGEHVCYHNYKIQRTISGNINNLLLNFSDNITPTTTKSKMRLHCGEKIKAQIKSNGIYLTHPESQYTLIIKCSQQCTILHGKQNGGIAGTLFCSYSQIDTIEFNCSNLNTIDWSIEAINKPMVEV